VQDRRAQRLGVEAQLGQNRRHRDRMGNVSLTGLPGLPGMRLGRDQIGAAHPGDLRGWQEFAQLRFQRTHIRR